MGRGESAAKRTISKEDWEKRLANIKVSKEDLNALVMNFFVTEGYLDAARAFSSETATPPTSDTMALADRMEIRRAVHSGDIDLAIDRVNDFNAEILEDDPRLLFHLQQQRFLEMLRNNKVEEALTFAQETLAPRGEENPGFLEELEKTVALLAFEDKRSSPLGNLLDLSQRQRTAEELNAAILSSQGLEKESRLIMLLKLLVWSQSNLEEKANFPTLDVSKPNEF